MTQEEVNELYEYMHNKYDYVDGYFINKKNKKIIEGNVCYRASKLCLKLHLRISTRKISIQYNHAIFIYFHKRKVKYLDYLDGNSCNNRIENLIESNMSKLVLTRNQDYENKNGYRGVVLMDGKYYGVCYFKYKKIYSKACGNPKAAHKEYLKLKNKIDNMRLKEKAF